LVALLDTVTVPVRVPVAVGRNVTVTVHAPPAAMEVPQVLVCEKSPLAVTPDTVAANVPVFVTVTF
jgi:ribosomal protein L11